MQIAVAPFGDAHGLDTVLPSTLVYVPHGRPPVVVVDRGPVVVVVLVVLLLVAVVAVVVVLTVAAVALTGLGVLVDPQPAMASSVNENATSDRWLMRAMVPPSSATVAS